MKDSLIRCAIVLALLFSLDISATVKDRLITISGKERVKVVYSRSSTNNFGWPDNAKDYSSNQVLVGFDSKMGIEDTIASTVGNYQHPLISYDGLNVVYSDVSVRKVYKIDWEGKQTPTAIANGIASCLWYDAQTNKEWVIYLSTIPNNCYLVGKCRVRKVNLNNPSEDSAFFNSNQQYDMAAQWLSISADGKSLGAVLRWPNCHLINISTSTPTIEITANGCWASTPYDNSKKLVLFTSIHDGWKVYKTQTAPIGALIDSAKTGYIMNHMRFGSYSKDLLCIAYGMPEEQNSLGGYIQIIKVDSSLSKIVDSVTVSESKNNGFPDVWAGSDNGATGIKLLHKAYSIPSANTYDLFSLTGRVLAKNVNKKDIPNGLFIIKNSNSLDQSNASILRKSIKCK